MLLKAITGLSAVLAVVGFVCMDMALGLLPVLFLGFWLMLALLAFLFLCVVCALVDLDRPQETDSKFYRAVAYIYIEALISLVLAKVHATGLEKTPKEGRFLLVCNHLFLADPAVLLHCFQKSQLSFITKQENQRLFVVGKIMHKILCQPLDRNNDRQALKVILKCIQMVKEDQASIGVFPEGYTSRDGKLHHFRSGVFKIAQKTNVPIVVCTIQNTREIFKNLKKLKRTDIQLHLVDVLQPEDYKGLSTVQISDKVYEMMIADLGQHWRPEE